MSEDLALVATFFGGIVISSFMGLFANEYVTLKYMRMNLHHLSKRELKSKENRAKWNFIISIAVTFLLLIVISSYDIIHSLIVGK
jgi:hypothetical protein